MKWCVVCYEVVGGCAEVTEVARSPTSPGPLAIKVIMCRKVMQLAPVIAPV